MSDFSKKELSDMLNRDKGMKLSLHRLTISKVKDKKQLAVALRKLYPTLSVIGALNIVNNLPFVDENMWTEEYTVGQDLSICCEFTYERIPFPGNENVSTPPWESPEYISAKNWYHTLSEDDRKKIDILVRGNVAWA